MIRTNCKTTIVCGLQHGEDLLEAIENAATKANARSGLFLLIGALDKARFGFYSEGGTFEPIDIERQLDITSCIGSLAEEDGRLVIHAHMTVSDAEGRVYGGHVLKGCRIWMRAELMIFQMEGLKRSYDKTTGLHVLQE
jgi:predicted DNA-binding protein with PD1-like motif